MASSRREHAEWEHLGTGHWQGQCPSGHYAWTPGHALVPGEQGQGQVGPNSWAPLEDTPNMWAWSPGGSHIPAEARSSFWGGGLRARLVTGLRGGGPALGPRSPPELPQDGALQGQQAAPAVAQESGRVGDMEKRKTPSLSKRLSHAIIFLIASKTRTH